MLNQRWQYSAVMVFGLLFGACNADDDGSGDPNDLARRDDSPALDAGLGVDAAKPRENPCNLVDCGPNKRCEARAVQCVTAPCPEVAACIDVPPAPPPPVPTCASTNTKCKDDQACVDSNGPQCVAKKCPATTCPSGSMCTEGVNGPSCVPAANKCAAVKCEANHRCIENGKGATECVPIVKCAATLCGQGSKCIDTDSGAECVPIRPNKCAALLCAPNTKCIETSKGAECLPTLTCATTLCAAGTRCVDTRTGPECRRLSAPTCATLQCDPETVCDQTNDGAFCVPTPSCKTVKCGRGAHCELQQVQCVRAPCPAQPICVADNDPCERVLCREGTRCVTAQVDRCLTVGGCGLGVQCRAY